MTANLNPILSMGTVYRMGTSHFWGREVGRLYTDLCNFAHDRTTPFRLEVHFHVGSDTEPVDFDQMRTGTVSRKRSKMWVQVPLHDMVVENPREVLLAHIAAAVELAEAHLKSRRIVDGLPELRKLVADFRAADPSVP